MNVLTTEHALARSAWENVNWLRRRVKVVHAGLTLSYELLSAISGLVEAGRSNLCANGRRGPMPIRSHAYLVSAATPSQLAHTTKGHFSPGQHRGDNADRAPVQVLPESAEEYPPNGGRCRPSFDGASEVHPLTQVVRSLLGRYGRGAGARRILPDLFGLTMAPRRGAATSRKETSRPRRYTSVCVERC
jgi:hypothetical protein